MTRRRAPRWLVEATAWTAAAVLFAGIGIVAFDVVTDPVPAAAVQEDVLPVVELREKTVRVPVTPPAPVAKKAPPVAVEKTVLDILGPPPGPQKDIEPAVVAAPADRYAFLAGVTDYRSPTHDTIGAANDVRYIAGLLEQNGWLPQNIRVVADGEATGAAIREGMAWLAATSVPGRTFSLFHFSGHVKQFGGGTEALWPVDRDWVRDTAVTAGLSQVRGKLWVDIAGCEAGSFLPGLPSSQVLVSASSKASEKSYEYPQWAMSVWSGLVFQLGTNGGAADADADGRVTIGEALRYSTYYAQAITLYQKPYGRQTPQVAGDPVRGWTLSSPPAA